jgi:hypothetical protein
LDDVAGDADVEDAPGATGQNVGHRMFHVFPPVVHTVGRERNGTGVNKLAKRFLTSTCDLTVVVW